MSFFFIIYFTITGVKKIFCYTKDFVIIIEVHYIEVPLYHFNLFIVLNTGKDGRDGRDGSGIKVGFFKVQTLLSLFAGKVQKFKLNDPWSCMSPVKWSLLCECIKLPKKMFFFWTFGLCSFQRKKNKI